MGWVVFVPEDALCFPRAALCLQRFHGGEVRADDSFRHLVDSLRSFACSQGGVSQPLGEFSGESKMAVHN